MNLIGKTITEIRPMTDEEMREEYWDERAMVLIFNDGTKLYPSRDDEGNGAGTLFGDLNGDKFVL